MRTLFIAAVLALSALSACSLYFGEEATHKQQTPDAKLDPFDGGFGGSDGGGCCTQPDGGSGSGGGCGDGGLPGDAGWPADGGSWPADGGSGPADGGSWPADGGSGPVDAAIPSDG